MSSVSLNECLSVLAVIISATVGDSGIPPTLAMATRWSELPLDSLDTALVLEEFAQAMRSSDTSFSTLSSDATLGEVVAASLS